MSGNDKEKLTSTILIANSDGVLRPLHDQRYESSWHISFTVNEDDALQWHDQLNAENFERSLPNGIQKPTSHGSLAQHGKDENSGSKTIRWGIGPAAPQLIIAWERPRGREMLIRARCDGDPPLDRAEATAFLDKISERCRRREREHFRFQSYLKYIGTRWLGELWLEPNLRLGPTSARSPYSTGPHVIAIDTIIPAPHKLRACDLLRERTLDVARFLSVVTGRRFHEPHGGHQWTLDPNQAWHFDMRQVDYFEAWPQEFPQAGIVEPIPTRAIPPLASWFPGPSDKEVLLKLIEFDLFGSSDHPQLALRDDTVDLWAHYQGLSGRRRKHFLRAAHAWDLALVLPTLGHRTASLAFMVVACEALKHGNNFYDGHNLYDVVEALLGNAIATQLEALPLPPQRARSRHVHRGERTLDDLWKAIMTHGFGDSSFEETERLLRIITQEVLIQWLKCSGDYQLSREPRSERFGRRPPRRR